MSHATDPAIDDFIAQTPDAHVGPIIVTDATIEEPGPHIVFVNEAFTRMFGYEAHEVLGRNPRMFQGPATERPVLDRLRAALVRGEPFVGGTVNYRKDGTAFPLQWSVTP